MNALTLTLTALLLTGCALTPTQQKWTGIAVGVVVVGAIAAHNVDRGHHAVTDKPNGFCDAPSFCSGVPAGK